MAAQQSKLRTFLFVCNLLATVLLVAALLTTCVFPEWQKPLHLDPRASQMITMNLISLLLLLAYLQRNLTPGWRIFALAGAFMVMAESWLISLA